MDWIRRSIASPARPRRAAPAPAGVRAQRAQRQRALRGELDTRCLHEPRVDADAPVGVRPVGGERLVLELLEAAVGHGDVPGDRRAPCALPADLRVGVEPAREAAVHAARASRAARCRRSSRGPRSPPISGLSPSEKVPSTSSAWSALTSFTPSTSNRSLPYLIVGSVPGAAFHSTPCVRSARDGRCSSWWSGWKTTLPAASSSRVPLASRPAACLRLAARRRLREVGLEVELLVGVGRRRRQRVDLNAAQLRRTCRWSRPGPAPARTSRSGTVTV